MVEMGSGDSSYLPCFEDLRDLLGSGLSVGLPSITYSYTAYSYVDSRTSYSEPRFLNFKHQTLS